MKAIIRRNCATSPFVAPVAAGASAMEATFSRIMRQRDVLLHHPYESFGSVVDFLEQAARDPNVLAIKQTLYRTGGDPRIVGALMNAVKNGKQVTAVTELKARFDEANNILWARRLEEAGVHVVYGIVNHKVHSKIALVVRRDDDGLRRYLHLGTGNYNPSTARHLHRSLSLFTSHPDFGEDATNLFNLLTGICQFQGARKFLICPFTVHDTMMKMIKHETENAIAKKPARIIAKMNALVDRETIEALYRASQAGVKIDLIDPRNLLPATRRAEGSARTFTVRSIVGRFLEHAACFISNTASIQRCSSAARIGCRETSSAALRSSFQSKTVTCAHESWSRFSTCSWRIRELLCWMTKGSTGASPWEKARSRGTASRSLWISRSVRPSLENGPSSLARALPPSRWRRARSSS